MDFGTLWRDGIGFWRVWVATLGIRHGLLSALPGTAAQIARKAPAAREPLRVWLAAAEALGLVTRRGRRFSCARGVRPLLVDRADPRYLGGHLAYGALESMDYDAFGPLFRRGRTLPPLSRPRRGEAIAAATAWDHAMLLRKLPQGIRRRLARGCDVLELGCGSGEWLRRMRRAFPRSRFAGVEPDPAAARRAGARVGRAETAGRARSADLVYLGEVLHLTDRPRALARCARVLRPGGWLLILEGFLPERISPRPMESVLFAMQLDQALQGARFMRRSELSLPAAFTPPRFIRLGGCVALAVARRR